MTPIILRDRLEAFKRPEFTLDRGGHASFEAGHCATESGDWLTGSEPCISPELRPLLQGLNDRWDDDARQWLKPFVVRALGTKGDGLVSERRRVLAGWLLHESLPAWMEAAGRDDAARRLRALPADLAWENVRRVLSDVRAEAGAARREAREGLKAKVRAEFAKRGLSAYAFAAAYAYAAYAADAAYAAASAASASAAAYAAASATATTTAADASAYVASAYAAAAADPSQTYDRVYDACYQAAKEKLAPRVQEHQKAALELLDRLLPETPALEIGDGR